MEKPTLCILLPRFAALWQALNLTYRLPLAALLFASALTLFLFRQPSNAARFPCATILKTGMHAYERPSLVINPADLLIVPSNHALVM